MSLVDGNMMFKVMDILRIDMYFLCKIFRVLISSCSTLCLTISKPKKVVDKRVKV